MDRRVGGLHGGTRQRHRCKCATEQRGHASLAINDEYRRPVCGDDRGSQCPDGSSQRHNVVRRESQLAHNRRAGRAKHRSFGGGSANLERSSAPDLQWTFRSCEHHGCTERPTQRPAIQPAHRNDECTDCHQRARGDFVADDCSPTLDHHDGTGRHDNDGPADHNHHRRQLALRRAATTMHGRN